MFIGPGPGVVVMGGELCSYGFESQHCILDGHFFTHICCKNWYDVCLKRPKIKKRLGMAHFSKKTIESQAHHLGSLFRFIVKYYTIFVFALSKEA